VVVLPCFLDKPILKNRKPTKCELSFEELKNAEKAIRLNACFAKFDVPDTELS